MPCSRSSTGKAPQRRVNTVGERSTTAGTEVVQPRLAATVILLRDGDAGPEVFMVRRHMDSDFVGGAYVFPGGRVDSDDSQAEEFCVGLGSDEASRKLQIESGGLALFVAAIRECFEEAGILLAYDQDGDLLNSRHSELAATERARLNAGEVSFLDIVRRNGWKLATDRMHYWAHWITPEGQPKRYDTRFFLTSTPRSQDAVHDDLELTHSAWISPQEALAKAQRKEWTIIFPTLRNLMTLLDFASTEEAEEAGRRRGEVETVQPRILRAPGGFQAVLPGDPGYEDASPSAQALGAQAR